MLIGSDYYWEIMNGEVRRGTTGPVAINTKLGWVLSGPGPTLHSGLETPVLSLIAMQTVMAEPESPSNHELSNQLRAFWELESLRILNSDKSVHDRFKENISYKEGRYEVSLPWKEFHDPLPDNYTLSFKRLQGLIRRFRQTPRLLEEYNATIQD